MDPHEPNGVSSEEMKEAARALASAQSRPEAIRRFCKGLGLLLCAVVLITGFWTLSHLLTKISAGPAQTKGASTAIARSCEPLGPISRFGFGYWWTCEADLNEPDGPPTKTQVHGSELTPADIGQPVPVSSDGTYDHPTLERDTKRPLGFMNVGTVFLGFLPCAYLLAQALFRLLPLWCQLDTDKDAYRKYYARYQREGRPLPKAALELPAKKQKDADDGSAVPPPQHHR